MSDFSQVFDLFDELARNDNALRVAALTAHTVHKDRIFGKGEDAAGGTIGKYSRKPLYVSQSQSPVRLNPKGKTGKNKFKDGTAHKSQYFDQGYFGFRGQVGRQTGFVDLRLSGQMEQDYGLDARAGAYVSGFSNSTNYKKATGNEAHFKKDIFSVSEEEMDVFVDVYEDEIFKGL